MPPQGRRRLLGPAVPLTPAFVRVCKPRLGLEKAGSSSLYSFSQAAWNSYTRNPPPLRARCTAHHSGKFSGLGCSISEGPCAPGGRGPGFGGGGPCLLSHSLALFTFLCLYFLFCVMGTVRRDLDVT